MHRAIADGVDRDGDARGGRDGDVARKLTRLDREDAAIPRSLVRLLERGALGSQTAAPSVKILR